MSTLQRKREMTHFGFLSRDRQCHCNAHLQFSVGRDGRYRQSVLVSGGNLFCISSHDVNPSKFYIPPRHRPRPVLVCLSHIVLSAVLAKSWMQSVNFSEHVIKFLLWRHVLNPQLGSEWRTRMYFWLHSGDGLQLGTNNRHLTRRPTYFHDCCGYWRCHGCLFQGVQCFCSRQIACHAQWRS